MKTEYQSVLEEFMDHRQPLQMLQNKIGLISEKGPFSITGPGRSKALVRFALKLAQDGKFDKQHMQQKAGRKPCTKCQGKLEVDGKKCDLCNGNKLGMIVSAGGGGAHDLPNISALEAQQAIVDFNRRGYDYMQLPDFANPPTASIDAPRNRARRPKIVGSKLYRGPLRQDGQATLNKRIPGAGVNARYGPAGHLPMSPSQDLGGSGREDEQPYYMYYPAAAPKGRPKPEPKRKKVTEKPTEAPPPVTRAAQEADVADRQASTRAGRKRRRARPRLRPVDRKPLPKKSTESTHYLSKTIDEEFCNSLEGVLGL